MCGFGLSVFALCVFVSEYTCFSLFVNVSALVCGHGCVCEHVEGTEWRAVCLHVVQVCACICTALYVQLCICVWMLCVHMYKCALSSVQGLGNSLCMCA